MEQWRERQHSGLISLHSGEVGSLLLGLLEEGFPSLSPPSLEGKQEYPEKQVLLKFKTILRPLHLNPEDSPVGEPNGSPFPLT